MLSRCCPPPPTDYRRGHLPLRRSAVRGTLTLPPCGLRPLQRRAERARLTHHAGALRSALQHHGSVVRIAPGKPQAIQRLRAGCDVERREICLEPAQDRRSAGGDGVHHLRRQPAELRRQVAQPADQHRALAMLQRVAFCLGNRVRPGRFSRRCLFRRIAMRSPSGRRRSRREQVVRKGKRGTRRCTQRACALWGWAITFDDAAA
jgi:hypothetical protein